MKTKWELTSINNKPRMARCCSVNNWVEERELNWYEKIRYFFKIKKRF